jgi:hypothetical protein
MVQLLIGASDGHELSVTLLRLDTSFTMTLRAAFESIPNSNQVLRPKPKNYPPVVLRPKPPKPSGEVYPLRLLYDLDACRYPSMIA